MASLEVKLDKTSFLLGHVITTRTYVPTSRTYVAASRIYVVKSRLVITSWKCGKIQGMT